MINKQQNKQLEKFNSSLSSENAQPKDFTFSGFLEEPKKHMDDSSTDSIPLVKRPNIFKGLFKENKKILGHSEEETKDIFCPICYAIIDEIKAQIDCCTHEYCFSCLEQWLKVSSACPLCKKDIT